MPTLAEAGLPGVEMTTWYGLFVTAGTPKDVVERALRRDREGAAAARRAEAPGRPGRRAGQHHAGRSSRAMVKSDYDRFGKLIKRRQRQDRTVKPTIALFTGDPAGIGPELVAKLLADGADAARARTSCSSARATSCTPGCVPRAASSRTSADPRSGARRCRASSTGSRPTRPAFAQGEVAARNGAYMLDGLALGARPRARAASPTRSASRRSTRRALRAGGMKHADELHYFCEVLGFTGPCVEFNVLDDAVDLARHVARAAEGRERADHARRRGRRRRAAHARSARPAAWPRRASPSAGSTRTTATTARSAARRST